MARRNINDAVWRSLKKRLRGSPHAKVGILASKGGGQRHPNGGATMVEIGAAHEFGAPRAGIPERSFIRRTFREKRRELRNLTEQVARRILSERRKMTVTEALEVLGQWGAAEVKKAATIKRKGSDLVDTGALVQSISHEVKP